MKIFCPINEDSKIEELVKYADEFYLSFNNDDWKDQKDNFLSYHSRGFSSKASFKNIENVKRVIDIIKNNKKEVFLVCNAHSYSDEQLQSIEKIMSQFEREGGDGFIVSDLNILKIANKFNLKIYLSTIFALYNISAVKALIKRYKVDRLILSRDVSYEEIKKFRTELNIEIECFVFLSGCRFSNGNCFCLHTENGGMCKFSLSNKWNINMDVDLYNENHDVYSNSLLNYGCGICAIYDFLEIGVNSIKITGREFDVDFILYVCKTIFEIRELAAKSHSKNEFIANLNKFKLIKKLNCENGLECFYPELGKWKDNR